MSQTEHTPGKDVGAELDEILNEYRKTADPGTYQIPAPKPAPMRSSLPTEEEVRAYLVSFARGEAEPSFEPRRKAGPVFPEPDERFLIGNAESELKRRSEPLFPEPDGSRAEAASAETRRWSVPVFPEPDELMPKENLTEAEPAPKPRRKAEPEPAKTEARPAKGKSRAEAAPVPKPRRKVEPEPDKAEERPAKGKSRAEDAPVLKPRRKVEPEPVKTEERISAERSSAEDVTRAEPAPEPRRRTEPEPEPAEDVPVPVMSRAERRRLAEPEPEPAEDVPAPVMSRAERRRLLYGGMPVDNSADENYTPPKAEGYIPTHIAPAEDEESPDEPFQPRLFRKLRDKYEAQKRERNRQEAARREAAEKIEVPEPEELILPGEKPPVRPESVRPKSETREPEAGTFAPDPDETEAEDAAFSDEAPKPEDGAPKHAEKKADKPRFTPSWSREAASHREYVSLFPDTSASPALYADEPEEGAPTENGDARIPLKKDHFFPANFREYLGTLATTVFYGLRKGAETIVTAEEDDEELGPEASPAYASRYYGRFVRSLRLRLRLCGVLLLVMGWISLGLPVFGQLGNVRVAAWFCFAIQGTIMLLSQDVLTGGVMNAFRRRFGADSLAAFACLATGFDALLVGTGKLTAPHMPLCLVSSLSLTGVLLASLLSCRGLRKALRVPAIAKRTYAVTGEANMKDRGTTILKSQRPCAGFVRRSEEAPADETLFQKMGLPLLLLAAFLTLLTMLFTRNLRDMIYIFSVLLCASVPFGALLCFALPFFVGSFRIFPSGAAIAGWSGLCDVGRSKNLIVTDRDLFPDGTVEIEQVRIFADAKPERIISYAGSMLIASGSCVSKSFADLMARNNCAMRQIEDYETLPGGGMKGVIDSSVILCGSSDLMQLMNVRIPFRLVSPTSILLAVDGVLYGIFNMKYSADPQVRKALVGLMRSGRHPIFAIRDFNITPVMLHNSFDVPTDGYDFPPYVERFAISSAKPGDDSKIAAVVCRDGLGPLSSMADYGRKMYVATRTSLYFTAISAVLGMLVCFIRMVSAGGVSVPFLFLFMLLCALPVLFLGVSLSLD